MRRPPALLYATRCPYCGHDIAAAPVHDECPKMTPERRERERVTRMFGLPTTREERN